MNAVMYSLGSYAEAEATIREICRVLRPGGAAYFGEIPFLRRTQGGNSHTPSCPSCSVED